MSPVARDAHFARCLGTAIRGARQERGLQLKELARRAGVCYQHLSAVETGKANVTVGLLGRICRGLAVPMPRLIGAAYDAVQQASAEAPVLYTARPALPDG